MVTCRADGGTFTLTFDGKTTARIPYNAKVGDLQNYLEALPTLGSGTSSSFDFVVNITFRMTGSVKIIMSGGQACVDNKDGTTWTVEFLQNFGDLPLMVPDSTNLLYTNALAG